ncbi:MAG: helix-turn-helix domain-containing protein [Pseudomonadota bacterium]
MLETDKRAAILLLAAQGHGIKSIARTLKISKATVRKVIRSGRKQVPEIRRTQAAQEHLDLIRRLHGECKGNLARVHEKLLDHDIVIGYSSLTRFCRLHEIGSGPKPYAGSYAFAAGSEMQHDTSPHKVEVGGKIRLLHCASLVLCFSRMIFAQCYATFNRFLCKVFLTDALRYFKGAAKKCMVDNTSVVIASGTGPDAVPAPEMKAFADRFNFTFKAHRVGDADRSARVERPFHFIENNFYSGRSFEDTADLNRQFVAWCDKVNRRYKKHIRAVPIELYQAERPQLKPLPIYVPDVQLIHQRTVDVEGYVNLHTNRYSMPEGLLGRPVQVRETKNKVRVFLGHKLLAEHARREDGAHERVTLPKHRYTNRWQRKGRARPPLPEEGSLRAAGPDLSALVDRLKTKHGGRAARAIKRLHRFYLDYPTEALCAAAAEAVRYNLCDLNRIERMVLRTVAGEFFRLEPTPNPDKEHDDGRQPGSTSHEPETETDTTDS